jgi:predicted nucleic acid-binding protein
VIYLDSSVALAFLFAEERAPAPQIWTARLVSSRLLTYELWTRIHAYKLAASHGDDARKLIALVDLVEMTPVVLARAAEPFPIAVRALDALHLASIEYLKAEGQQIELATYDERMRSAASALNIDLAEV